MYLEDRLCLYGRELREGWGANGGEDKSWVVFYFGENWGEGEFLIREWYN